MFYARIKHEVFNKRDMNEAILLELCQKNIFLTLHKHMMLILKIDLSQSGYLVCWSS